jgi:hypothetical protein
MKHTPKSEKSEEPAVEKPTGKIAPATKKKVVRKKSVAKKTAKKVASAKKRISRPSVPLPGTPMTEALGETFLVDLITDWRDHGGGVIETCRTTKPDAYLKLVATYAPREFRKTLEPFEGMNDHDLQTRLTEALEEIRTLGFDLGS